MLEDEDVVVDVRPTDPDESGIALKPWEQRINTQKIELGIFVIVLYAALSLYLMSPPVKKYIFHSRPDREIYDADRPARKKASGSTRSICPVSRSAGIRLQANQAVAAPSSGLRHIGRG